MDRQIGWICIVQHLGYDQCLSAFNHLSDFYNNCFKTEEMCQEPNYKIVLIGCPGVGKTNIATRFINDSFTEENNATRGVELLKKKIEIDGSNISVTLWDTVGQERYKAISKIYYKSANAALIVYDITNQHSYQEVASWFRLLTDTVDIEDLFVTLVGNKIDLESKRVIVKAGVQKVYKGQELWQVSAKTGENINPMFEDVIRKTVRKAKEVKERDGGPVKYRQSVYYDSFRESIGGGEEEEGNEMEVREVRVAEGSKTFQERQAEEMRQQRQGSAVLGPPERLTLNNEQLSHHHQQLNKGKNCCQS